MARCWVLFLLIGMVFAGKPHKGPPMTFKQAVDEVVKRFNAKAGSSPAYRMVDHEEVVEWESTVKTYRYFKVTIQETVCNNKKTVVIESCEYKAHGVKKTCRVGYRYAKGAPDFKMNCKKE